MNKIVLFFVFYCSALCAQNNSELLERQGNVTFFSYTSVENIKAENNQVRSFLDTSSGEVAVSILMKAFAFEKSLMQEHFNESYIESDLYPKASFTGVVKGFDPTQEGTQTRLIKGDFTLKNVVKSVEIKTNITKKGNSFVFDGVFEVLIDDYKIKVPPLLSPNIAKNIKITFNFQFDPNENQ